MASYHFAAQIISRGQGRSAIAAAAYRAGARLEDAGTGRVSDYAGRRGVVHAAIMAPEGTAAELLEREQLWNAVEAGEKRKDAQLAREINVALPHELDDTARAELLTSFIAREFVARGMIADFAIHTPVAEKGDDPRNHHAHIMLTLRQVDVDTGRFFRTKTREWNADAMLTHWRGAWAEAQNEALARHHVRDRVDHRSLKAQRADAQARGAHAEARLLDREPELHVGVQARAAAQRGHRPQSRERTVNLRQQQRRPNTRQGRGPRQTRTVAYPQIDGGRSRLEANIERMERNLTRLDQKLTHLQVRHQRWRRQLAWLDSDQFAKARQDERAAAAKAQRRDRDFVSILQAIGSLFVAERRRQRLRKVVSFEDSFIGQLLGLKSSQLKRKRDLARTIGNSQAFGRARGRTRDRKR